MVCSWLSECIFISSTFDPILHIQVVTYIFFSMPKTRNESDWDADAKVKTERNQQLLKINVYCKEL